MKLEFFSIRKSAIATLVIFLTGCTTIHTINESPNLSVEPTKKFSNGKEEIPIKFDGFTKPWWENFERPALNQLIDTALIENYNVAESVAVLKQARSIVIQTQSQARPQVNLQGSRNTVFDSNSNFDNAEDTTEDIGLALSWEIDIWNRVGYATQSDRQQVKARIEDIEAIKLSLSAEVANAYFGAVSSLEQIKLLNQQLDLDKELERILQLSLDAGIGTSVDLLQQQAQVADSETLIPLAESDLAVYENRLDVLLGDIPDAKKRVSASENLAFAQTLPTVSVPAALLLNRPDLRSAKADLVAADADIGEAIADRYPAISIDGTLGFSKDFDFSGLVSSLTGSFVQPLLDWGERRAEVKRNKALYEERLAAYTQLFLIAVEEVENALVQEAKQREFLTKLKKQRRILQQTVDAAEMRFKQGVDDYQPVIIALQTLRVAERSIISAELALLTFRIDLFRAIGGPINSIKYSGTTS